MARRARPLCSLGWELVNWIERYLCHGPGDLRGEPIELDDEFAAFIVRAYELDPITGRRLVNRAFLSRPKGRAKSELAGMLVCAELLGPVRFERFDRGHNPIGRPVRDPFIRCLATEEGQAGNTYDNVVVMLGHVVECFADEFARLDVGITRVFVAGGGEVRPSTAASASKDGGKETFAVADETHLWCLPELRAMHDTVTRNLVKRRLAEPWMLETSTMYQPGQDSVAEATHDYHRQITAGRVANRGLLFDHRQGAIPEDWDDDSQLAAGLREAYGAAAAWVDLTRVLAEIRDPKTTKASAARYFLNRAVAEEERWVSPLRWAALADPGPPPEKGAAVALGFDGSQADDTTALVGVSMADPPRLFVLGIWERPEQAKDWQVPRAQVHDALAFAFEYYRVAACFADPPYWREELAGWIARFGEAVVVEFPTSSWSRMARAVDRIDSVIRTGVLRHDGDATLARHVTNAHRLAVNVRRPELGFVLGKDRKGSPHKIDAAVAATLAVEARDWAIANGWKPRGGRPRVYGGAEFWERA